jgi:hypothetical protein
MQRRFALGVFERDISVIRKQIAYNGCVVHLRRRVQNRHAVFIGGVYVIAHFKARERFIAPALKGELLNCFLRAARHSSASQNEQERRRKCDYGFFACHIITSKWFLFAVGVSFAR